MRDNARGREIIDQILENMRGQTEELRYSKVVSSAYNVHLHPDDYARLEGLVPEIADQACRALDEELERLNRPRPGEERLRRLAGKPRVPYRRVASDWSVQVFPDPNEELEPGDILVDATLAVPDAERFDGNLTRRIVTHRHGDRTERRVGAAGPASTEPDAAAARPALATLRWRDPSGEHEYRMTTPSIKIGRGGQTYWVDVRLETLPDVSREHARIRWDEAGHRFLLQDLSTFGTTLDGKPIPARPGQGAKEGEADEVPLPPRARIGLAGVLELSFEASP